MIFFELLGQFIMQIIFEGIIGSSLSEANNFILKLRGIETGTPDERKQKKLEKKYLYKKVKLLRTINPIIKAGMTATVLDVINNKQVFVEVSGTDGLPLEYIGELAFTTKILHLKLTDKK